MTTKAMDKRLQRVESQIRGPQISLVELIEAIDSSAADARLRRRLASGAVFGPGYEGLVRLVTERRQQAEGSDASICSSAL